MEEFKLNLEYTRDFIGQQELDEMEGETNACLDTLERGNGAGNDFRGWLHLPSAIENGLLEEIKSAAQALRSANELVVVIGIGGSYLGAKAVTSALEHQFPACLNKKDGPAVLFAGQNIGEDYLHELFDAIGDRNFGVIVISKSGTTTEPALAFRLARKRLEVKYGAKGAADRIVAITDKEKGALRKLSEHAGYRTFVIPDGIGGRYSVLTPVGLLPIAVAGFDVDELVGGAARMEDLTRTGIPFRENPAALYAAVRNLLYRKGRKIEILANFDNRLVYFSEWWKQLYGESEGKDGKGIFPASASFTTDLHSMGQYIQEGERSVFETVISIASQSYKVLVPEDEDNLDGLNYLGGRRISEVNKMAELATRIAHADGGVPNLLVEIPRLSESWLGSLIYFFEKSCGISGYLLGINPFNQPGVEAYKTNMFALLGKPGFEKQANALKSRIR